MHYRPLTATTAELLHNFLIQQLRLLLTEYFVLVLTQHGTQLSHSVNVQMIFGQLLFYLTSLLHSQFSF